MNGLRSTVRDLWNVMLTTGKDPKPEVRSLASVRQKRVAGVLGTHRFHDADNLHKPKWGEAAPVQRGWGPPAAPRAQKAAVARAVETMQRDGFETRRRALVDLTGGIRTQVQAQVNTRAPTLPIAGFLASLGDVGLHG